MSISSAEMDIFVELQRSLKIVIQGTFMLEFLKNNLIKSF